MRRCIVLSTVLMATGSAGASEIVLFTDDFESGLGAWTPIAHTREYDDTPHLFSSTDPLLFDNIDNPGSNSAGFSSSAPIYDGTSAWLQKQFPAAVPPGTYTVRFECDWYVYMDPEYRAPQSPDPWAAGNRIYVLTDDRYDNKFWDPNPNDGDPGAFGFTSQRWPGRIEPNTDWSNNGKWLHLVVEQEVTTSTGNFEIRLYWRQKYHGMQAVAWDNITFDIGEGMFVFTENWEAPGALDAWDHLTWIPELNDTPRTFTADDPDLFTNTDNPGSQSAGFSSNYPYYDNTEWAALQLLLPEIVPPGANPVHSKLRIECDWYVYKDPDYRAPEGPDPWAVGNRIYLLTDERYNLLTYPGDNPGDKHLQISRWPGRIEPNTDWSDNGVWQHLVVEHPITSDTGNYELRLLSRQKYKGAEAVAWDNLRLSIVTPCNNTRFDMDGDGDVDQEDFGAFQACFSGIEPAVQQTNACICADSDNDGDVDSEDYSAFEACASGPTILAGDDCDAGLPLP